MADISGNLHKLAEELRPHFKSGLVQQLPAVFQFLFHSEQPIHLIVFQHDFVLQAGIHKKPKITLFIDCHASLSSLLMGKMDSMQAFLDGKYRSDGNIVLSQVLLYLFKPSDNVDIHQIED